MEAVLKCGVCLNQGSILVPINNTDDNNIKWSSKLKLCVPEVDWLDDHLICKLCIDQLETAYKFRDLCLKSWEIRKYLNKPQNCDMGDISSNNIQPLMYHCKHCIGIFKSSYELAQHNINIHFLEDCPYTCTSCDKAFKTSLELIHHEIVAHNDDNKNGYNSYYSAALEQDFQSTIDLVELQYSNVSFVENTLGDKRSNHNHTYKCYGCGNLFNTKKLLISHLNLCSFLVTDQPEIDIHKNVYYQQQQIIEKYVESKCPNLGNKGKEIKNEYNKCIRIVEEYKMESHQFHEDAINSEDKEIKGISTVLQSNEDGLSLLRPKKRTRKKLDHASNTCSLCGLVFNSPYLVKRHTRNVHATEKNYSCNMCEQKFTSAVYLNAHKRYHSGKRPHICPFCGKGFITGSDLYHHEKIHTNKRAYKCETCSKAFNTSSDLHKHKLCVHLDRNLWKYVCTFCERRFPLKTNLDAHTKTHTGERNFACHLCDRKCVNRSVLMRHVNSHSNVRLFKCSICQSEYKYKKSLDIHLKKAHGIGDAKVPEHVRKFFCDLCPKSYFANNKLQKHIRTHTGERPFSCQLCGKRFIDKSYVKQHLKVAHSLSFCQTDT